MLRILFSATTLALLSASVHAQMTQFCFPGQGTVIGCPCANPPAGGGLGCNNFGAGPAKSGTLDATGFASLSADTILLNATGENDSSFTCFWTGRVTIPNGLPHAAGVRCVNQLKRLYPEPNNPSPQAIGGAVSRPGGLDTSTVSVRTMALEGAPIQPGETRYYFCIYRDNQAAVPCGNTDSTLNLTNAGSLTWAP